MVGSVQVDMPVFFFIDPEYDLDMDLVTQNEIVLTYHFYEAEPGKEIPLPGFMRQNQEIDSQPHTVALPNPS